MEISTSLFGKKSWTVNFNDVEQYGTFAFQDSSQIKDLKDVVLEQKEIRRSTWHGKLEWVKTFRIDPLIPLLIKLRDEEKCCLYAVLPSILVAPNAIVGVFEEFRSSLLDLSEVVDKITKSHAYHYIHDDNVPWIFLSLRVSQLWEKNPRQLFFDQAFGRAISIFQKHFKESPKVRIAMTELDYHRSGLWEFSTRPVFQFAGSSEIKYVILEMEKDVLFDFYKALVSHDGIVFDTLAHIQDLGMLSKTNHKLSIKKISANEWLKLDQRLTDPPILSSKKASSSSSTVGSEPSVEETQWPYGISSNRCISPKQMEKLIRVSIPDSSSLSDNELQRAIHTVMIHFNGLGYSYEQPLKYIESIRKRRQQKHMIRSFGGDTHQFNPLMGITGLEDTVLEEIIIRDTLPTTERAVDSRSTIITTEQSNGGQACYRVFSKKVRTVGQNGYRVENCNCTFYSFLLPSIILPGLFIAWRTTLWTPADSNDSPLLEDILSASLAIATAYTGFIVTILLSWCYRGEEINDVARNFRNIDTQEEFNHRSPEQTSDIMEILRKSKDVPSFLGGGNISFIHTDKPRIALDAIDPMPFSNIETVGYVLYEDKTGEMYMVDPWFNLFRVSIVDKSPASADFQDYQGTGLLAWNKYIESSFKYIGSKDMTLYCKQATKTKVIEPYRDDEKKATGNAEGEQLEKVKMPRDEIGCLYVSYESLGEQKQIYVSRILPYGARRRSFGEVRGRKLWRETTWRYINNYDILRMDIGIQSDDRTNSDDTQSKNARKRLLNTKVKSSPKSS